MLALMIATVFVTAMGQQAEAVGKRPYEMVWANRTQDDHPPLVDFENLDGWQVVAENAVATFERSREQQIWGRYVGKLTYRGTGGEPLVRILPPKPIDIPAPFDAVECWIYGNNWAWIPDPTTPPVNVRVLLQDSEGREFVVYLETVHWKEWFLCHRRLTPEQIARVKGGAKFLSFNITNGRNSEDRVIYFDNLAFFKEEFPPLTFAPRPKRGIPMFPGQTVGTNTGPGKLPFPTRLETILPDNLTPDFKTTLTRRGRAFVFTYSGDDGELTYRITPETGTLGDITARWKGRGAAIRPCVGGGVYFATDNGAVPPEDITPIETRQEGDTVVSRWRLRHGDKSAEVTYRYRLWNKSLVIDVVAPGGQVQEVRYGHAVGLENPRLVTLPYYPAGAGGPRPAVVVDGPPDKPLFLMSNTCWYLSNASQLFAVNQVKDGTVTYNGGTRYIPKTDGKRNDCYERLFITVSPRFEEVLPTIPNPQSPWKQVTGTHVWRAHGASDREADLRHWTECHRYGMTQVVVTDHETMWRDGGESFTFRTRAAPGKGGDKGEYDYARAMQDKLGFVYGPYNNFTDFAPVNEYWDVDMVIRTPDNQLQRAWPRCYAPKPARAVEYCEMLAPKIQEKFHFSTAYCDVHTAVAPWDREDYDWRVPGAGTFAATFYAYGEIMLLQKAAWNGPVYSEGNNHFFYCGLTDGNYAQDQRYDPANNPWLVDFDLRKMHDLCCNFGMGNIGMFYSRNASLGESRKEMDEKIDRFLAATVAFGHTGFLIYEGGLQNALRSYYMLQQLHSRYALSSVDEIRYADENGNLLDTTAAVATGAFKRSQVVTRYANGCVTVVNGHPIERMTVKAYGRKLDLPPNGYAGWTSDGSINVFSGDVDGHRADYAATPAYIYVDGRGKFVRFPKAAGNGIGICRNLGEGKHEIIPYKGADVGFAVGAATAAALDKEGKELGPAQVRVSRGLTYIVPVEGAFSYILRPASEPNVKLSCARDDVVAGERVVVKGEKEHELTIPADVQPGDRIWRSFEGGWIDFTVVPLADTSIALEDNKLHIQMTSNLPEVMDAQLICRRERQTIRLEPKKAVAATVDLGPPEREAADVLPITLRAGALSQRIEVAVRTVYDFKPLVSLPKTYKAGICLRGGKETFEFGETRARVHPERMYCGRESKKGLFMHPPWVGGVGYSFALYDPVKLPDEPVVLRASVGKRDGSNPGDGILFKVAVVEDGREKVVARRLVTEHKWEGIEADLTPWAGRTIQLKLITDVGENDDSTGDWGCWADMRIESREQVLVRKLVKNPERYRHEPGPFPVQGLTIADLRRARAGWIHYDGMGLTPGPEYPSFAVLNGIQLGSMAPAPGRESDGVWDEQVRVPLTAECIQTLGARNVFTIKNLSADCFKVRRFWIELELADGRKCSSDISTATFTQPPTWKYAEGIGVPRGDNIEVEIWFDVNP